MQYGCKLKQTAVVNYRASRENYLNDGILWTSFNDTETAG